VSGQWFVDHLQHEYVPDASGSSTLVADGSVIQTLRPENLHFVLMLGSLGPGTIDYEVSRYAKDDSGVAIVSHDFVGPYRTDFRLRRSDLTDPVMAGMHTSVTGLDADDTPIENIQVAGKDWLHYLERRVWPYDATLGYTNWPTGFRFKVTAGEVGQIVKDILETVRDVSANYPLAPDVLGPNPSYSLGFTVDADSTGVPINYDIATLDSSSIYSLVQTLSQQGQTRGGFEFYMTWDKVFKLVAPEIGNPLSPIDTLEVDAIDWFRSVGFTNTGPEATHVLGVGAGTSNQQGGINKHFPANSAVYRRHDKVADFGNVKNLDALESLTSLELAYGSNPIHDIPVEVSPEDITNFWTLYRPGEYVSVIYDLGFHQINSVQKIVSMDCTVDTEGVEKVQLGFNQFYDASDHSGINDW